MPYRFERPLGLALLCWDGSHLVLLQGGSSHAFHVVVESMTGAG